MPPWCWEEKHSCKPPGEWCRPLTTAIKYAMFPQHWPKLDSYFWIPWWEWWQKQVTQSTEPAEVSFCLAIKQAAENDRHTERHVKEKHNMEFIHSSEEKPESCHILKEWLPYTSGRSSKWWVPCLHTPLSHSQTSFPDWLGQVSHSRASVDLIPKPFYSWPSKTEIVQMGVLEKDPKKRSPWSFMHS